ncbi:DUF29 domain-containing protein [Spirulina subsalsa]|uniref:DUF29 domain-containing protein n=1 Tax=Spirulina subsalsa TaxID=54311 RepID=UPI0002D798DE|nr:DUF29 domain-containing protein [Spirulina subsalsa]
MIYEQDFHLWLEDTIQKLTHHQFSELDIEHLIAELQDLGKSDKNALESNLMILLAHLLKLTIQADAPQMIKGSWYSSVDEHRQRVLSQLVEIPSLKSYLETALIKAYPRSRKLAIKEGKRASFGIRIPAESEYPDDCPFPLDAILSEDFYGGA